MLIQMLIAQPQMIGTILARTPTWVWFLFAGLVGLGVSQLKTRTLSAVRAFLMPVAMTGLSLWGTVSAFSQSAAFGQVMLVWVAAAVVLAALIGRMAPPAGASYRAQDRTFTVPGNWVPLALIVAIFLVKYVGGIETAMNPGLTHDASYTLTYGAIYGAISGIFTGRSIRLARLALRTSSPVSAPIANA